MVEGQIPRMRRRNRLRKSTPSSWSSSPAFRQISIGIATVLAYACIAAAAQFCLRSPAHRPPSATVAASAGGAFQTSVRHRQRRSRERIHGRGGGLVRFARNGRRQGIGANCDDRRRTDAPWRVRRNFASAPEVRSSLLRGRSSVTDDVGPDPPSLPPPARAMIHDDDAASFLSDLTCRFQGDFDNYRQVLSDRRGGMLPAEGGGHEHIHCTLVPMPPCFGDIDGDDGLSSSSRISPPPAWVLAAFYFNGNPNRIFRFRMYRLAVDSNDGGGGGDPYVVRMKLHTLLPELEQRLRDISDRPTEWATALEEFQRSLLPSEGGARPPERSDGGGRNDDDEWERLLFAPLQECDVLWTQVFDPSKHPYIDGKDALAAAPPPDPLTGYHATMEAGEGGVIVDSVSMIPGKRILIKDELSLWEDDFWINDRGYDPDAARSEKCNDDGEGTGDETSFMPFVYGNQRCIPYKLERVTAMTVGTGEAGEHYPGSVSAGAGDGKSCLRRVVVNTELEWTLGNQYSSEEMNREKIEAVEQAYLSFVNNRA